MITVSERYQRLVKSGEIEEDPAQLALVEAFDGLNDKLANSRLASKSSSLGWLFARKQKPEPVKGLYIWGSVGRGKSMLMDLFYESCPNKRKWRVHFHAFMGEVHERIHAWREQLARGEVQGDDAIPPVANAIADDVRVLCFDEFFVTDIADAMILGRLFDVLFSRGVVVVATSNVVPSGLYKDGLNRALFLPFIDRLEAHMQVMRLDSRTDFRLEKLAGHAVYYTPLGQETRQKMDEAWGDFTGHGAATAGALHVLGREVVVPQQAHGAARFAFSDLCEKPLGANDFLALAQAYHTVFIDDIPQLEAAKRNEAKRFTTLIDALYENGVKLVASAAVEAHLLHGTGKEAFAFERTASRLIEMRSEAYLAAGHGQQTG